MIAVTEYKNQKIGVFGLGKAGEATVAALLAGGAEVYAWDDNQSTATSHQRLVSEKNASSRQSLAAMDYTQWPWDELKALVLSPGVPLTHPKPHEVVALAKKHQCPIIGDIELLYRACPDARYVAITGTNGKSTTTTLLGHILKTCGVRAEIGGNLGTPALALAPLGHEGVYVLETSSYQLDLLDSTRFNVAVWLNITPDHLDRHGSMEGYVAAKKHIFDRQQAGDTAVIAVDDEYSKAVLGTRYSVLGVKTVPVSTQQKLEKGIYVENGVLHDTFFTEYRVPSTEYPITPIQTLTGRHNWQNAAAAYAAARAFGLASGDICKAMTSFAGLRHRLQLVATIDGVRFINDSKATNAAATSHALAPYDRIYWIAGGKPKEGGIASLEKYFSKIAHAFLIGEAEAEFARTLEGKVLFTRCGTLKVAVEKAAAMAKKGSVVLLSPACASFDQFKNFEERGDAFCRAVEAFASGTKGKAHAV